jgi:hypothetical protein
LKKLRLVVYTARKLFYGLLVAAALSFHEPQLAVYCGRMLFTIYCIALGRYIYIFGNIDIPNFGKAHEICSWVSLSY